MNSAIKAITDYNKALPADLKKLKWVALSESPFRFFRGTCHLFADDFKAEYGVPPKLRTWMCGDMHFENFGSYKGENRLVYFDINDFDEAVLGAPEPELARFLSSIIVAGWQMKASDSEIDKTIKDLVGLYATTLERQKALMMEGELAKGVLKKYFKRLLSRDRESFIARFCSEEKGSLSLNIDNVHLMAVDKKKKLLDNLRPVLKSNKHFEAFQLLDVAFRLAGTGSLGLQRYCMLCYDKSKNKHYLVEVKEARRSCWIKIFPHHQPEFENEAARIIHAENMMQFNSAAFLTTTGIGNKSFVVKEMQPLLDKLKLESFKDDFGALREAAFDMAPLIAYAQIRSSGHRGSATVDELARFAGKSKWRERIVDLSAKLADNNNRYYASFIENENNVLPGATTEKKK